MAELRIRLVELHTEKPLPVDMVLRANAGNYRSVQQLLASLHTLYHPTNLDQVLDRQKERLQSFVDGCSDEITVFVSAKPNWEDRPDPEVQNLRREVGSLKGVLQKAAGILGIAFTDPPRALLPSIRSRVKQWDAEKMSLRDELARREKELGEKIQEYEALVAAKEAEGLQKDSLINELRSKVDSLGIQRERHREERVKLEHEIEEYRTRLRILEGSDRSQRDGSS